MTAERKTVLHDFCAVPAAGMRAPSINKEGRVLMAVSKAVENGTGVAVISQERIATMTGLSRRSVNAALTNLETDGVLTIHDRGRRERGCYKVRAYALDYTAPADHGGPVDAPREDGVHMDAVDNPSPMRTPGSHGPCEDGVHTSMRTPGSQLPDRQSPDLQPQPDRCAPVDRRAAAAGLEDDHAGQGSEPAPSAAGSPGDDGMQADDEETDAGGGNIPPTLPMVTVPAVEGGTPTRQRAKQLKSGGWKALINRDRREGKNRVGFLDTEAADECQRRVHQNNEDAQQVLIQLADAAKRAGVPKWRPWCGMVAEAPGPEPAAQPDPEPAPEPARGKPSADRRSGGNTEARQGAQWLGLAVSAATARAQPDQASAEAGTGCADPQRRHEAAQRANSALTTLMQEAGADVAMALESEDFDAAMDAEMREQGSAPRILAERAKAKAGDAAADV